MGLLIGIAPLVAVTARLAMIGELDLFDSDAELLSEQLHGPLAESFAEYKLRMTSILHPDLVILGSSRVMQLRGALFDGCSANTCVYNAGGAATTMLEALEFVEDLPRAPRVIVLGLDVWQFDPNDPTNTHEPTALVPTAFDRLRRALGTVRTYTPRLYDDESLRSVVTFGHPVISGTRGVRAILRGEGFRPDGSYSYAAEFMSQVTAQRPETRAIDAFGRIERGCCRFEHFSAPDSRSLGELEHLIATTQTRGTAVLAYLPPYADLVADAVERDPRIATGFSSVRDALAAVFARNAVPFVALTRASQAGCAPEEMLDGFHPSEVCSARVLARLLALPEIAEALRPYVAADHVRRVLAVTRSPYVLGAP